MGSLYKPKYRNAEGKLVESSVWWLSYYANGRQVRESSKTDKESKARGMLRVKEGDAVRGIVLPTKVNRKTVADILAGVVQDYEIRGLRSKKKLEDRIRLHLAPFFGPMNAATVSDEQVREFVLRRQHAKASNAEINRELAALRRAYNLASKTVTMRPDFPTLKERGPRSGFFNDESFAAVCEHLPPDLIAPFHFAYITGWRIHSEVLALPWRLVDFEAGEVRLEPGMTKTSEGRVFPFSAHPALAELLTGQRAHTDAVQRAGTRVVPLVFHRNGKLIKDFYGAWDKACERAGHPGRIVHDLRRSAVRNLVRAGVSEGIAMQLTGHRTRAVFEAYNVTGGTDLRDAVARLALSTIKVPCKVGTIQPRKRAAAGRK